MIALISCSSNMISTRRVSFNGEARESSKGSSKVGSSLRVTVASAHVWNALEQIEGSSQLFREEIGSRRAILAPPRVDSSDLVIGLGSGDYLEGHFERVRSSSTMVFAGFTRPVAADTHARRIASLSACRSSSVRSSPSSSTTSSRTVPSGKLVGSSSRSRPSFTLARMPDMLQVYALKAERAIRASRCPSVS